MDVSTDNGLQQFTRVKLKPNHAHHLLGLVIDNRLRQHVHLILGVLRLVSEPIWIVPFEGLPGHFDQVVHVKVRQ